MDSGVGVEDYLAGVVLGERTRVRTAWVLRSLVTIHGTVNKQTIRAWLAERAGRGVCAATRAADLACIRRYGAWLKAQGLPDPSAGIASPASPSRLPPYLTVAECAALCEHYPLGTTRRAALELLYGGGLRAMEGVGLTWADVDLEGRWLVRVRGKGGQERSVPFGVPCQEALAALLPPIHGTVKGRCWVLGGVGYAGLYRWVVQAGAAVLGEHRHLHPHALRHACATHLTDNGADIRVVQAILGHTSAATTAVYLHVTEAQSRAVYDRVWRDRYQIVTKQAAGLVG